MQTETAAGFNMVELTISLAVTMVVFAGVVSVQNLSSQVTLASEQDNDAVFLFSEIFKSLKNDAICKQSFATAPNNIFPVRNPGSAYSTPSRIFKKDLSSIAFESTKKYKRGEENGNGHIQIQRLELGDFEADTALSPGAGKASLHIHMQKVGAAMGAKSITRTIRLQVNRDPNPPYNMQNCVAVGGSSEIWKLNPNGSIHYSDSRLNNIAGNIGVGADKPDGIIHMITEDSSDQELRMYKFSNTPADDPAFTVAKARGTKNLPLPNIQNDELNSLGGIGWQQAPAQFVGGTYLPASVDGVVSNNTVPGRIEFWTANNSNANRKMRIDSSGRVGIGASALFVPSQALDVEGSIRGTAWMVGGNCIQGVCASDRRLKTSIKDFKLGLDVLLDLYPKYYSYNGISGHRRSAKKEIGLIAQDIEKAAPQLVIQKKIKEVNYTPLIYIVINSIKVLEEKLTASDIKTEKEIKRLNASFNEAKIENDLLREHLCQVTPTLKVCHSSKTDRISNGK